MLAADYTVYVEQTSPVGCGNAQVSLGLVRRWFGNLTFPLARNQGTSASSAVRQILGTYRRLVEQERDYSLRFARGCTEGSSSVEVIRVKLLAMKASKSLAARAGKNFKDSPVGLG